MVGAGGMGADDMMCIGWHPLGGVMSWLFLQNLVGMYTYFKVKNEAHSKPVNYENLNKMSKD